MKQIIQNLKTGETALENIPAPQVHEGQVLVQTSRSLVSLGTERMLVEFGHANLIQKARQQPDKVKMVLDKIRSDGLLPNLEAVFNPQISQIYADWVKRVRREKVRGGKEKIPLEKNKCCVGGGIFSCNGWVRRNNLTLCV